MAVFMKRSTKIAPESLSTSYFTGSPCAGISMMTLKSSGRFLPEGTLFKLMLRSLLRGCESLQLYHLMPGKSGRKKRGKRACPSRVQLGNGLHQRHDQQRN